MNPVTIEERIPSLDVLRGIAVLGILLMNIQAFGLISAAYMNPFAYGDISGGNYWAWTISHVLADSKFLAIFSLLFGAGMVLFAERGDRKGKPTVKLFIRRSAWLLVIGLLHAYLFWSGDILVTYALLSFVWFWVRNWSPKRLFSYGLQFLAFTFLINMFLGNTVLYYLVSNEEQEYLKMVEQWMPNLTMIEQELQIYRGNWFEQMPLRVKQSFNMQTTILFFYSIWNVSGWMLVGMGLYKWGYLSAIKKTRTYLLMMLLLIPGFAIIVFGVDQQFGHSWTMEYSMFQGKQFNFLGSILVVFGYIGAIMLWMKNDVFNLGKRILAATGRMALTNYLMQTLICTTIFYGHGFGLFGSLERTSLLHITLGIWLFQLTFSFFWLKKYTYGPMEWVWRKLTYKW